MLTPTGRPTWNESVVRRANRVAVAREPSERTLMPRSARADERSDESEHLLVPNEPWRRFLCRGASRYRFIARLAALHLPQGLNHLRELFGVRWHERFSVRNGLEDFDEVFQLRAAGGW